MAAGAATEWAGARGSAGFRRPARRRRGLLLAAVQRLRCTPFGGAVAGHPSALRHRGYAAAEVVRSGKSDSLARSTHPMMRAHGRSRRVRGDRPDRACSDAGRRRRDRRTTRADPRGGSNAELFQTAAGSGEGQGPVKEAKSKPLMRLAALENPAPAPRPRRRSTRSSRAFPPTAIRRRPWSISRPRRSLMTAGCRARTGRFSMPGKRDIAATPISADGCCGSTRHFGDPRVLLHIPPGFDANKPSVMIVFFHGHGATLSRDVRDRQQVPAQISASGVNAVLVAPQFAVDAADSSPGKFGDPGRIQAISRRGRRAARQAARRSADETDLRQHADRDRGL